VAAGDQDDRGPGTRQQRADLAGVPRVVQYHEHPAAGEQAPVERGALVERRRDALARHAQSL